RKTTELTDVFAVGITLFRACNYISDWNGAIRHFADPMSLIRSGQLVNSLGFAPFVPLKLRRVINKACAPNPTDTYESAAEFRQAIGRLSPKIDWVPTGKSSFEGVCTRTNAAFSIALAPTRSSFNVEVKKNDRKQRSECQSFDNFDAASKYLFGYVSSS